MPLNFSLNSIRSTEFGVGREDGDVDVFSLVPVDAQVQDALKEMAAETGNAMEETEGDPEEYQPSEKYSSQEYVILPLENDAGARLRHLHQANNLPVNTAALDEPADIFCYFARFRDARNRRLTAIRRATQFKGLLKSRNRLIRIVDDTLRIVEDTTFKLDRDFDLLVDPTQIHILRPSGFEFIAQLQEAIRQAVPGNIAAVQRDMPFVDFSNIEEFASHHTRAARHLASIRSQRETQNVSQQLLRRRCRDFGAEVQMRDGRLTISPGSEMIFLDILDRRMYDVELVEGAPEQYRASSRRRVGR